ncbi:ESX secretion system ATPase EccB [Frankia sp. AiPs1]|uniref:type VII secretion protein EccB n=1 Tax=Frankia sp. AiPa1 TaxID=573492 RepID=UPI00202B7908|nr:type VII secretion protein EccB [Frankia sp. AiPa1]MCL9762482.1 type VII secretion protein EccB [Frankia sp. AiPa1]
MQSRRDQVDAHNYLLTRLTSALVRAEPDALELPTRRDTRGLVGGAVLAVLMLGVVAIWALLFSGGSTVWRQPGKLIIEKSTGSRFLLQDGELRPVRNLASARLALDGPADPVSVSSGRLAKVPRGEPLGSLDAPDLLPAANKVNTGVWRACATVSVGGVSTGGAAAGTTVRVDIGGPASTRRLADGGALVSAGGPEYLLWRGRRLALGRPWAADVLGYGDTRPIAVDPVWLALLPAGPDLVPVDVPGRGGPGPAVGGRPATLGQLFAATAPGGTAKVHYLLLSSGLVPLSATQAALALGEAGAAPEGQLTPTELVTTPRATLPEGQQALPATPPPLRTPADGEALCVQSAGRPDAGTLDVVLGVPPATAGTHAPGGVAVSVRPGGGALLVGRADVAARDQRAVLVDGAGVRYRLDGDALRALGFTAEQATVVPPRLVALLPAGPPLTTPRRQEAP